MNLPPRILLGGPERAENAALIPYPNLPPPAPNSSPRPGLAAMPPASGQTPESFGSWFIDPGYLLSGLLEVWYAAHGVDIITANGFASIVASITSPVISGVPSTRVAVGVGFWVSLKLGFANIIFRNILLQEFGDLLVRFNPLPFPLGIPSIPTTSIISSLSVSSIPTTSLTTVVSTPSIPTTSIISSLSISSIPITSLITVVSTLRVSWLVSSSVRVRTLGHRLKLQVVAGITLRNILLQEVGYLVLGLEQCSEAALDIVSSRPKRKDVATPRWPGWGICTHSMVVELFGVKAAGSCCVSSQHLDVREGLDEVTSEPLVLIVVPTRELAVQIFNEARKLCYRTMLRPGVVYGGVPLKEQTLLLQKGCDVLIRFIYHVQFVIM
ncbi:ATP-dependent RNA helicase DED1 [Fusarium odoratissimum]|uniref:ATP-dependent RNA helicase DED1 n=1 Tax=Fusarium oxysporum f. sp. cubense (strain race 4) TaxID=2502994 RepID=N1RZ79_FUSC4|nr:ATP-dependent RNA helicase DED1 [Fusarium odoratissimum]